VHQHSTKVFGIDNRRLSEGEKCDSDSPAVRQRKNFTGEVFWARGYFVSTVGLDEATVRAYIRKQEREDERYDQMNLNV
jgi:putative transposase